MQNSRELKAETEIQLDDNPLLSSNTVDLFLLCHLCVCCVERVFEERKDTTYVGC